MLTANRLRDGDVVYWRAGGWVGAFEQGEVFPSPADAEAALAAAQKSVAANVVVNAYLFEVRADADGVRPAKEREIIRAAGPTIRGDLGKQANAPHRKIRTADFSASPARGEAKGDDDVSI